MFRRILVSTDGSARSNRAIKAAAKLARTCGASLTIFHVIQAYRTPYYVEGMSFAWPSETQYVQGTVRSAARLLASARRLAAKQGIAAATKKSQGVSCETVHVRDSHPADGIIMTASQKGCDLIVMASHGRKGLGKLLLGSETQKVLTSTKLPVLVVR